MRIKTYGYLAFSLCALASVHSAFAQQNYPARPVRVVVPYPPGGITDVVTRIVAQEVSKVVNQNVLVDNRPGANSILGVDIVSKATPDGYTLVSVIAAHAANQTLYPKLPYDSVKSFAPVSLLVTAPLIVTATNNLAAKDAKELVALAKAKPGALSFGSSGIGAATHLTTELLMLTTGIKLNQDIRERLIQMGIDPVGSSSAEFDTFLRNEVAKWAKVIKEAGVKIEG